MEGQEPPKPPPQDWADFMDTGRKWQRAFVILLVILIIIALVGAFFYKTKHRPQVTTKTTTVIQTAPSKITSQTKTYSSPNFYLSISYPVDWTVKDSGGGVMTITSTPIGVKEAGGQNVTGQIILTFRNSGQPMPEFDKGNATATLDSQKIAYTKPSQNQRANTYLSFLTYASTPSKGIDGIYVTGDYGYKKDQAIPKVDIQKIDPIISVTFVKCSDKSCTGKTTPMTIAVSTWADAQISEPITKMLESLTIT